MLNVMKKDLIMNRTALVFNLVILVAFLTFMSSWEEGASTGAFAFFAGIMMAFVPVMIVTREDKFNAMALGCSLPVSRKTIVGARYLLGVGSSVLGVFLALVVGSLTPTSRLGVSELFRLGVVLHALSVTTLALALLLPFTLRFGARGLILALASSQVFGIVALTVVKTTRSSVDQALVGSIIQGVADLHARLGGTGFYLLLLTLLAAVLWCSYLASVWVFQKREF